MENGKNNILVVVCVVVIGALAGVSLLLGIGNAVSLSVAPMTAEIGEIAATQRAIENKLNGRGPGGGDISGRLAAIEQRLSSIETALNNGAGARPSPSPMPPQPPQEDLNKVYDIEVGKSPVWGKKDAPVTIVEFSDLQCPFCARFYPPLKETLNAYPNQVRFILKNFPLSFHPNARPAAKLALAANLQGKYFEMVELLLDNGGDVSDDKIKEYAKKLNINYNRLVDDYKKRDAEWEQRIQEDMKLGQEVDVRGTPTFYINGRKTNAREVQGYKAEIDKILAEKK